MHINQSTDIPFSIMNALSVISITDLIRLIDTIKNILISNIVYNNAAFHRRPPKYYQQHSIHINAIIFTLMFLILLIPPLFGIHTSIKVTFREKL